MVHVGVVSSVFRRHVAELRTVIEGKGQQLVKPTAPGRRPVNLFEAPVLAQCKMRASGLDHMSQFGL